MDFSKDYYKILGVDANADFDVLKKAYYKTAKSCHPDLYGGDAQKEEDFKTLLEAFNILSDPESRSRYDDFCRGKSSLAVINIEPVMDSFADDCLEELIVGNHIPAGTTLKTLMTDLENTEKFCLYRQAKNQLCKHQYRRACNNFSQLVNMSQGNILYRFYYARSLFRLNRLSHAKKELNVAIQLGAMREPPQRLENIRKELRLVCKAKGGFLERLRNFFFPEEKEYKEITAESMSKSLSRSISRLDDEFNEEKKRKSEQNLLN